MSREESKTLVRILVRILAWTRQESSIPPEFFCPLEGRTSGTAVGIVAVGTIRRRSTGQDGFSISVSQG